MTDQSKDKCKDDDHCMCWCDGHACCRCGDNPPLEDGEEVSSNKPQFYDSDGPLEYTDKGQAQPKPVTVDDCSFSPSRKDPNKCVFCDLPPDAHVPLPPKPSLLEQFQGCHVWDADEEAVGLESVRAVPKSLWPEIERALEFDASPDVILVADAVKLADDKALERIEELEQERDKLKHSVSDLRELREYDAKDLNNARQERDWLRDALRKVRPDLGY